MAIPTSDTILVSPGKDYVLDALKKIGHEAKPVLKNKKFQALLEKLDDRQSLSVAVVPSQDEKGNNELKKLTENLPGDVKGMIEKIHALGGGFTVGDEIKLELVVSTKNAADAN